MAHEKILVIEDEEDLQELIRYNLSKEGYQVSVAGTGEEGLTLGLKDPPHLVVLDLMLPGMDGLEVCRALKSEPRTKRCAIVMVTAKGDEADIVAGLEVGADDYLPKPFSPRVLLARVRAVLRRQTQPREVPLDSPLQAEGLDIDPKRHRVTLAGTLLELTASEFKMLYFLVKQRGWVFTRAQIVEAVHGDDYPVTDRSVDVQIVGLRRKLGAVGKFIETVRGIGYRFRAED